MTPTVGRTVHYVAYGSAGGEYPKACRAAVVAEAGQWVTTAVSPVDTTTSPASSGLDATRVRTLTQEWNPEACALAVLNPGGLFFNGAGATPCLHDEETKAGGTWHWPERADGGAA